SARGILSGRASLVTAGGEAPQTTYPHSSEGSCQREPTRRLPASRRSGLRGGGAGNTTSLPPLSFLMEEVYYVSLTVASPGPFAVPKFQAQSPPGTALPAPFGRPRRTLSVVVQQLPGPDTQRRSGGHHLRSGRRPLVYRAGGQSDRAHHHRQRDS